MKMRIQWIPIFISQCTCRQLMCSQGNDLHENVYTWMQILSIIALCVQARNSQDVFQAYGVARIQHMDWDSRAHNQFGFQTFLYGWGEPLPKLARKVQRAEVSRRFWGHGKFWNFRASEVGSKAIFQSDFESRDIYLQNVPRPRDAVQGCQLWILYPAQRQSCRIRLLHESLVTLAY